MTSENPHDPAEERELADVAAFADGSLPEERRSEVAARIAASPRLAMELERQREALRAIEMAAVPAPERLRRNVEAMRRPRGQRRRAVLAASGAVAVAAAALVVALVLPSGTPEGPSVAQAVALASRGPETPPPARYDDEPALLAVQIQGVRFPRWQQQFGWRAIGARSDRLGAGRARTVYYRAGGRRLAYTIVGGTALPEPQGRHYAQEGTRFQLTSRGGAHVLSWRRKGHTCVVTATGVPVSRLLQLASWRAGGRIEY